MSKKEEEPKKPETPEDTEQQKPVKKRKRSIFSMLGLPDLEPVDRKSVV